MTGNESSTNVFLLRQNVETKVSHVGWLACRSEVKPRGTSRSFLIAQSLTTHASTQLIVGEAKHHRQNTYLTAMFSHYI